MEPVTAGIEEDSVPTGVITTTPELLADRIRSIGTGGRRVMIGLAGPPGAGKSTLANQLVQALAPESAVVVPMDGYHLAAGVIAGTELAERRGAIDTFDGEGFRSLVERLRADDKIVYAPRYAREIEDPIGSAIAITPRMRYLIVEGNYLLAPFSPWLDAREHLDETWYLDIDRPVRLDRLIARHVQFGKSLDDAYRWSHGSDEKNAEVIEQGRRSADFVIRLEKVRGLQTVSDGA